jgi:ribosomal protein L11 methyltransferase
MDSIELTITVSPREPWSEIIVSELADYGFDAFVDTEEGVIAYGPSGSVDLDKAKTETLLNGATENLEISFSIHTIPHQNWNAMWEADFKPVFVEERMTILAPFHDPAIAKGLLIVIQPQMSFGTGHHQTTWLMSKRMLDLKELPSRVLDMGTGTGVLAILAEKLGAQDILAIDIEPWSAENTIENAARNTCTKIETLCGDVDLLEGRTFDLILANINKNILKKQIPQYSTCLLSGGELFLSGFFTSDVNELVEFASNYGFEQINTEEKETWATIALRKI